MLPIGSLRTNVCCLDWNGSCSVCLKTLLLSSLPRTAVLSYAIVNTCFAAFVLPQ